MSILYRCFDKDGSLIYVGSTMNIVSRLSQHKSASNWISSVSTITIEHYETKREAYAAEINAVSTENPLLNVNLKPRGVAKNAKQ